ncbi:MAG: helix-turn-helix transcriptional regulator [Pseudobutyrivibrio sp.]|nr:helix-turn-helix transcriptional regulator [Pseudobutyrivibrio sp.]
MKITNANSFGKAIKDRRKALGYTQQELSDFCGMSTSFLSNLENGKETCEIGKAMYIASILGLDLFLEER